MTASDPHQILLVVADIGIRQDSEGRYCLNDLHKAAGGEKNHQPANWLRAQQTQELIAELTTPQIRGVKQNQPLKVYNGGIAPGSFACKDLVYDYAMWISASFKVKVIRAYDTLVNNPLAGITPLRIGEMFVIAEKARLALEAELAIAAPKAQALDRIASAKGSLCITDAAKTLQIKLMNLTNYLLKNNWVYRRKLGGPLVGRQDKIDAGYLEHKVSSVDLEDGVTKLSQQLRVTPLGLSVLAKHFNQMVLPLVFAFGGNVSASIQ